MPPLPFFLILIFVFFIDFLWFIISPRYLLFSVVFSVMFPSFIVFFSSFFEFMIIILLFSSPNTIWYLFAVLTVMFNSVCKSFSLSAMRSTSSIHRRHPILVLLPGISIPMLVFSFSLAISSIIVELLRPPYWLNLAFLSRSIKFGGAIHMTLLTNIGYGYTLAAPCG